MILSAASYNQEPVQEYQTDLHGVLQHDMSHGIRGWVLDKNKLSDSLTVTICFDRRYQFHIPANQMRQNLCDGIAGHYGFDLNLLDLPLELFESPIHQIRASVFEHQYELAQSPLHFDAKQFALQLADLCEKDMARLIEKQHVIRNC